MEPSGNIFFDELDNLLNWENGLDVVSAMPYQSPDIGDERMTGQHDPILASTSSFQTRGEMADLWTELKWTPTVSGEGEEQGQEEPCPSPENPFVQQHQLYPEFPESRYVVRTGEGDGGMMMGEHDPMLASVPRVVVPFQGERDVQTEWTPEGEGEEQRQEPVPSPDNPFRQEPPLDPEFLPCRYVVQTDEQAYIKKDEVVQLTTWANTRVALCIVHSSPKYRSHTIVGTRLLSEEDTNNSSFPLRAWAAGESPLYREIELPNIGEAKCAVVQVGGDGHINLQFTELSTSKKNHGNTKEGKLSELLVFRVPESLTVDSLETAATLPIQVVAELRDPAKLKKPKRSDVALATRRPPLDDVEEGGRLFQKYLKRLTPQERRFENDSLRAKMGRLSEVVPQ